MPQLVATQRAQLRPFTDEHRGDGRPDALGRQQRVTPCPQRRVGLDLLGDLNLRS